METGSTRTTLGAVAARLSPDLLLIMFDAGVAMGLGIAPEMTASAEIELLIIQIRARWFGELEAARAWRRTEAAQLLADEMPAWLLAYSERQTALADSEPPAGLETAPLGGAK